MAAKNIRASRMLGKRIVGYLPPEYHQKLREYMAELGLGESAAHCPNCQGIF